MNSIISVLAISNASWSYITDVVLTCNSYRKQYHTVKNFGGKKLWRIRTVGSLVEKTLAN